MKFVAINGSPRKNGNCATLIESISEVLTKKRHTLERVNLYDLQVKGCIGCMACTVGKVEICVHKDDFTKLVPTLQKADGFIFASPVYMGQITGPLKTFIDRFYTFVNKDFTIRQIEGKKFVTIVTCGAPAKAFPEVSVYLKHWLGKFFKLSFKGSMKCGGLFELGAVKKKAAIMRKAEQLALALLD